jgi:hypothetical protein
MLTMTKLETCVSLQPSLALINRPELLVAVQSCCYQQSCTELLQSEAPIGQYVKWLGVNVYVILTWDFFL